MKQLKKIYEFLKKGFEETQTTWLLWPSLPRCVSRPALTRACFQFETARIIYLDVSNCACFAITVLGSVQHYNSCYYDWLTADSLPSLQALTQSSAAEVMPGSQARNPCSQQGYEIRSKFRGLLSRPCNNSINQTG